MIKNVVVIILCFSPSQTVVFRMSLTCCIDKHPTYHIKTPIAAIDNNVHLFVIISVCVLHLLTCVFNLNCPFKVKTNKHKEN